MLRAVVAPGGGFAEKCWPVQNFAEIAAHLSQRGCSIVLVGGKADKPLAAAIAAQAPHATDLTGRTSLRETFALIEQADLVICNPSMAMHTGAALRKKTAVGLGPWFTDAAQHRRQWGYQTDFIMLEPAGPKSSPEHMLIAMERAGWLQKQAQAA
jgi:heptosyltransferase-2